MAPAAASDTTLPPLIEERLGRSGRLVVSVSASIETATVAAELGERAGIPVAVVVTIGPEVAFDPSPHDLYVHGIPDVFGRLLRPPSDLPWVIVRSRMAADLVSTSSPVIDVGQPADGRLVAGGLHRLFKPLCQQRSVRPVFRMPPALGLPFIAPHGVQLGDGFARPEAVTHPGLPDLMVVRPVGDPPPGTPALVGPAMVIP
jgi:hypothetical protein